MEKKYKELFEEIITFFKKESANIKITKFEAYRNGFNKGRKNADLEQYETGFDIGYSGGYDEGYNDGKQNIPKKRY